MNTVRRCTRLVAVSLPVLALAGCGLALTSDLLAPFEPVLVGGEVTDTALGSGAAALAGSVWAVYRTADDQLLFRLRFDSAGRLVEVFDNRVFGQPWLGETVVPDGVSHPTGFAGGSYVSGAYVAGRGADVGVLGILHGFLNGERPGSVRLTFSGAVAGDQITGTLDRSVEIFAPTPFPPPDDAQIPAYGLREQ